MKFIVASDFHADLFNDYAQPTKDNSYGNNDRFAHQIEVLKEVFNLAQQHQAGVIFNGDLYNQRRAINPIVFSSVAQVMREESQKLLDQFNLPTLINVGNHDQQDNTQTPPNSVNILAVNSSIQVFDKVTLHQVAKDEYLLFVPYSEDVDYLKQQIKDTLPWTDKKVTVVAHVGVAGSVQGRWNHRLGGAFTLSDLQEDKAQAVVLGHYHKRQDLSEKAFYVGNTVPMNHNDDGDEKGVYLVDTSNGDHTFISIASPLFKTLDLNTLSETELDNLEADMAANYIKVIAHDKDQVKQLQEKASQDDHINVNIALKQEIKQQSRLGVETNANELEIVQAYTTKYYPEATKVALDILNEVES